MKIRVLVADAFALGGAGSTNLTKASALARRGHDVDVVCAVGSLTADPERKRRVALGQASRQTALADAPDALAKHWQGLFESLTVT